MSRERLGGAHASIRVAITRSKRNQAARITAFDLATGEMRGQLHESNGHMLMIDGLWGLAFGNGLLDQPTNALFFTAGPDDENHGLYGRIDPD